MEARRGETPKAARCASTTARPATFLWPETPVSPWNPFPLPGRDRTGTMAPVMEPQALQDEKLISKARAWRRRALRVEKDVRDLAHELEREVRRESRSHEINALLPAALPYRLL